MLGTLNLLEELCHVVSLRGIKKAGLNQNDLVVAVNDESIERLPWFGEIFDDDNLTMIGVQCDGTKSVLLSLLRRESSGSIRLALNPSSQSRRMVDFAYINYTVNRVVNEHLRGGVITVKLFDAESKRRAGNVIRFSVRWEINLIDSTIKVMLDEPLDVVTLMSSFERLTDLFCGGTSNISDSNNPSGHDDMQIGISRDIEREFCLTE